MRFEFVKAGEYSDASGTIIWRFSCDIIWLDEEPGPNDPAYAKYREDLLRLERDEAFQLQRSCRKFKDQVLQRQTLPRGAFEYVSSLFKRLEEHGRFYKGFSQPPTVDEYHALCVSVGGKRERAQRR